MGEGPITFQSIYYWQKVMRHRLDVWEVRLLRKLSILYMNERAKGENPGAIRPWRDETAEKAAAKAAAVNKSIKDIFKIPKKDS